MAEKKLYGATFGPYLYDDTDLIGDPDSEFPSMTWDASVSNGIHLCAGVRFLDTNQSNHLTLTWNENDTADRMFQFLVGGGNRSLTLNENFTIGDGSAGTLTFGSACTLTVELASILNQDLTTDASPAFASLSLGTGELTVGSINRASGSLTLEIGGTVVVTIAAALVTLVQTLALSDCVNASADVDKFLVLDASNNVDYRTGAEVLSDIGGGGGDVTAATNLTDHNLIRGDGGAKGVQTTGITIADTTNNMSGVGTIGCGTITTTGNLVLPTNGVVGVTDSNPQIVFDNANNWLEITGRVGIGIAAGIVTPLEIPGSTTNSSAKFGAYEIQSHSVNDCWLANNLYFDGTNWRYRADGFGAIHYFLNGEWRCVTVPSGLAGNIPAVLTTSIIVSNANVITLSSLAGVGSRTVVADANGVLSAP